jgi:ABC-type antimicrobial peptide transport system permease subunit
LIATIGQYAVVAFDMRRRHREFGLRLAMGASSSQIVGAVLREGLTLAAGLAIGFVLSVAAGTVLQSFLVGVSGTDGLTYAGVFALLAAASLLACYLPAHRASRVDPLTTLRCE